MLQVTIIYILKNCSVTFELLSYNELVFVLYHEVHIVYTDFVVLQ